MRKTLKRVNMIICAAVLAVSLSACTQKTDAPFINLNGADNSISYTMVSVVYDDVILTKKLDCIYVQTSEQEVTFDVTGKYVDKVYVKESDKVKKGDLLCELSSKSIEESIEDLKYKIERNELLLGYLDTDEHLEIQDAWLYSYNAEAAEEQIKRIKERYDLTRQNYNDNLEFDRAELKNKEAELRNSRIYASIDGIVYKIKDHLEGSTTRKDEVIMTIVDNKECLFAVRSVEDKDLFTEGVSVPMKIPYSNAAGDYELMPKDIDSWDERLLFSVFTGPDTDIEVGTTGSITAVLDEKKHVLTLPKYVVHEADGRSFVYVVNDENVREIKWIETGLYGDSNVEIVSGLEDGEKVVKK